MGRNRLSAVIAAEKSRTVDANEAMSTLQLVSTDGGKHLLAGLERTYTPRVDGDLDRQPPQSTKVQVTALALLDDLARRVTAAFDVVATKDRSNCDARADVIIEGQDEPLLTDVPVTHLLYLERELGRIRALFARLPILDPTRTWESDGDLYKAGPVDKAREKKMPRPIELSPATNHFAAQVHLHHDDVVVGTWTEYYYSGALKRERVRQLVQRVDALLRAVKTARENANSIEAIQVQEGKIIFDYLFAE